MLCVKNISKSYTEKSNIFTRLEKKVLDDISFTLEASEILAIVGESGSGKSTLARQIVMLERPDNGKISLSGIPLKSVPSVHRKIRMIFQNPAASLNPHKRVNQQLQESLLNFTNLSPVEREIRIRESLERVGLVGEQTSRYPHMLSGGQRQRVAIARALILKPDIIVADEAVSALDVSVQSQIINLILDLKDELGISWIFITHDISVVRIIANKVVVLYGGKVMEMGSVEGVLGSPLHPYTRQLLQSVPEMGVPISSIHYETVSKEGVVDAHKSSGCIYRKKCTLADITCEKAAPPMQDVHGRSVACHKV